MQVVLKRKNIRNHSNCYSRSIQKMIECLINFSNNIDISKNYVNRKIEYKKWVNMKKIKKIEINQKVDVRDTENIWCIGIVKKILANKNHSNTLLIHYQGIGLNIRLE